MICLAATGRVRRFSLPDRMKPREFCREWFNVTLEEEQERGYKERCIELLAEITGVGRDAVDKWGKGEKGKGLEFGGMPTQYEKTLAYAMALKRIAEAAYKGNPRVIEIVLEQLKSRSANS